MEAVLMLATAVVGWGFAIANIIIARQDERETRARHADELALRDARIEQLIDQVQLNTQHLPYYPQIGPFEPVEDKRYIHSDDGLISFEDSELDDALEELGRD